VVQLGDDVELQLTINLADEPGEDLEPALDEQPQTPLHSGDSLMLRFL
jgi:hypothetical protein